MSLFGENRTFAFVLAAVCLLIGVALVFVLFRIVFGRGIKLPGGRSRQQRLGIVDAFEIDRQRQLVIVRRDNVEHLIMIGGPNDVVVESSIIRAEAREARGGEGRPPREREQPAISGLSWPAGPAATEIAAQSPAEPAPIAARANVPEPPPISVAPPRPQPPQPAPRPQPEAPPPPEAGEQAGSEPSTPPAPGPTESADAEAAASHEGAAPAPAPEPAAPAPDGEAPEPQAAPEGQPSTAPKIELDPLESLEEEMAKLLGRNPSEAR